MPSAAFIIDDAVFQTSCLVHGVPLKMAAKRYSPAASPRTDGKTLIFLHANGTHKEHWESVIANIFVSAKDIKECWALDFQSHGESALLNAKELVDFSPSISDWARGVAGFVETHLRDRYIVLIGHSAGTSAAMFSTKCYRSDTPPYECIILVEPPMIDRHVFQAHLEDRKRQTSMLTKAVAAQRNSWDNRKAAFEYFSRRVPWKTWDSRVIAIHVNQGLRPLNPDDPLGAVTTKCTKYHESASYTDFESTFEATEQIEKVCDAVPIHIIYGRKDGLVPQYSQDSLSDVSKGRKIASISRVLSGGHLLVQEDPDALSAQILCIISPYNHNGVHRL
ncbi:alpha/beta-hydrolase [Armillaria gallica]|uniref:Alpha/beta-hydrolase n=1 Tax=Armillaria gallica TaxID=47427 RepID=A0A2H3E673_ARMGA|nr:alpha/beta-hydrolase [Armillaria gallica]